MEYGKSEGIRRTQEAARRGLTSQMLRDIWDSLWREPTHLRWSGFYNAGASDATLSWSNTTKIFSIEPANTEFSFFQYRNRLTYHRITTTFEVDLSAVIAEGLYVFYFAFDSTIGDQNLLYILNPTETQLNEIYLYRTVVSFLYWDATNNQALTFGNDCHGSEINPQQHWINHQTLHGLRKPGGLAVTGMQINEDGTDDAHAKFSVSAGTFWHDDFEIDITAGGGSSAIPVLYFSSGNPRLVNPSSFQVYESTGRLNYNNSGLVSEATELYHVCYHVFATNDQISGQQLISVMGQAQYEKLATAFAEAKNEVNTIYGLAPQQGLCYLGTVILQTSDDYTNAVKSRIVGFSADTEQHPAVTIAEDSADILEINEEQELSFLDAEQDNKTYGRKDGIWAEIQQSDWEQTDTEAQDYIKGKPSALDGDSAYEIAVTNGFVGTEAEWLASLEGTDGTNGTDGADGYTPIKGVDYFDGADGTNGTDGADGDSAYEIAVNNGFVGTEAEWLASLEGTDGTNGTDGADGYTPIKGVDYFDGADGTDGADGIDATKETWSDFEFGDFTLGTARTYVLNMKARVAYTIDSIVVETDTGTLSVAVKINGVAVTGLSSLTASTTETETSASAANSVAIGDRVTFVLGTGYTGTPTLVRGQLNFTID